MRSIFSGMSFLLNLRSLDPHPKYRVPTFYTLGVTSKVNGFYQKNKINIRPGFETTIKVLPEIIETTKNFDYLNQDIRNEIFHCLDHVLIVL